MFVDAFLYFDIEDVIVDFAFDDFVVDIAECEGIHADHVLAYATRYRLVGLRTIKGEKKWIVYRHEKFCFCS